MPSPPEPDPPRLTAFAEPASLDHPPEPAPRWRQWMDDTSGRMANRCLPLLVANEHGWVLRNPHAFVATWSGGPEPGAVRLEWPEGRPARADRISSHFGHGVVTWVVPFLFRTSPGWNLLARGPANWPKDGAAPLEGLVETDWTPATFTMNWKLTRPAHPVRFEAGEPFCMLVPQQRGLLEAIRPDVRLLAEDEQEAAAHREVARRRHEVHVAKFLGQHVPELAGARAAWEQDYFRGRRPDGSPVAEHQTKLRLAPFGRADEDGGAAAGTGDATG